MTKKLSAICAAEIPDNFVITRPKLNRRFA
jgi:hypothetical protein